MATETFRLTLDNITPSTAIDVTINDTSINGKFLAYIPGAGDTTVNSVGYVENTSGFDIPNDYPSADAQDAIFWTDFSDSNDYKVHVNEGLLDREGDAIQPVTLSGGGLTSSRTLFVSEGTFNNGADIADLKQAFETDGIDNLMIGMPKRNVNAILGGNGDNDGGVRMYDLYSGPDTPRFNGSQINDGLPYLTDIKADSNAYKKVIRGPDDTTYYYEPGWTGTTSAGDNTTGRWIFLTDHKMFNNNANGTFALQRYGGTNTLTNRVDYGTPHGTVYMGGTRLSRRFMASVFGQKSRSSGTIDPNNWIIRCSYHTGLGSPGYRSAAISNVPSQYNSTIATYGQPSVCMFEATNTGSSGNHQVFLIAASIDPNETDGNWIVHKMTTNGGGFQAGRMDDDQITGRPTNTPNSGENYYPGQPSILAVQTDTGATILWGRYVYRMTWDAAEDHITFERVDDLFERIENLSSPSASSVSWPGGATDFTNAPNFIRMNKDVIAIHVSYDAQATNSRIYIFKNDY